jgi:RimJ/RimL family protein N-acetyltransferase
MRRSLERSGFAFEGRLRGYGQRMDGSRIDGAMYALLKDDWQNRRG